MSAAPRYETVLLTPRQHAQLLDILKRIADPANAGTVVGLLKAQPALGGRVCWLFENARELLAALEQP